MKIIYLTQKQVTQVDDEDFEHLNQWRWCAHKGRGGKFYAMRNVNTPTGKGRTIYMHSYIMKPEPGFVTDHTKGDTLNNQKKDLRNCTKSQNSMNKKSFGKTSQYKGVYLNDIKTKTVNGEIRIHRYWKANISVGELKIAIGTFKSEENAAIAYNIFAEKHHGSYAVLNK